MKLLSFSLLLLLCAPLYSMQKKEHDIDKLIQWVDSQELLQLHQAVEADDMGTVLKQLKDFPHIIDKLKPQSGETALHVAAEVSPNAQMVNLLIDNGASLEATSELGDTPLFRAASVGNHAGVKALLARGARVNAITHVECGDKHFKFAPLHAAAIICGDVELVRTLLQAGADRSLEVMSGVTLLTKMREQCEWEESQETQEMIKLLENFKTLAVSACASESE